MGLFSFFRKKEPTPPKEVRQVFERMTRQMEGHKLADEAISYRNVGNFEKAFQLLETALRDFGYKPAITLIGTTKVEQGDIQGAIQWFTDQLRGLSVEDGSLKIELYANLGSIHNKYLKDFSKALAFYEQALKIPQPADISKEHYQFMLSLVHHDLAVVYTNLDLPSLAAHYAKLRLTVVPDCPDALHFLTTAEAATSKRVSQEMPPSNRSLSFKGRDGRTRSLVIPSGSMGFLRSSWQMFLDQVIADATREGASPQLRQDLTIVMEWLEVASVDEIHDEHLVLFSQGYEQYLREKKTPIAAKWAQTLQSLFVADPAPPYTGKPLSAAICGVMDRLMASDKEIQSETTRQFDNWDNRVLCSDGECVGTIGHDGRCRVCGKPSEKFAGPNNAPYQTEAINSRPHTPTIDLPASMLRGIYRRLLTYLITEALKEQGPAQLKRDLEITMEWLGVTSIDQLKKKYDHFIYGVVVFLMEPNTLAARSWTETFTEAREINSYKGIPLTAEIREVMDRLLDYAIRHLPEILESMGREAERTVNRFRFK